MPAWEKFQVAAQEEVKRLRTDRARALRAIRRVDRPLARFALKRWRDGDEVVKAATDMLIYGTGIYKVEHVPVHEPPVQEWLPDTITAPK